MPAGRRLGTLGKGVALLIALLGDGATGQGVVAVDPPDHLARAQVLELGHIADGPDLDLGFAD